MLAEYSRLPLTAVVLAAVAAHASANHIGTLGVTGSGVSKFGVTHLWRHISEHAAPNANAKGFWWGSTGNGSSPSGWMA